VPARDHQVRAKFTHDSSGLGKSGDVAFYVAGAKVGEGQVDATVPVLFSADETINVGTDIATPVSDEYGPKTSAFTGRIQVEASSTLTPPPKTSTNRSVPRNLRVAMARQ
jgi:hypothetical protein